MTDIERLKSTFYNSFCQATDIYVINDAQVKKNYAYAGLNTITVILICTLEYKKQFNT